MDRSTVTAESNDKYLSRLLDTVIWRRTGHNLSQTDANSTGGESGRHVGHTGTGCYKNHEHSMLQPSALASASAAATTAGSRDQRRRLSSVLAAAAAPGIVPVVTPVLAPAAVGIALQPAPTNNLLDLGTLCTQYLFIVSLFNVP